MRKSQVAQLPIPKQGLDTVTRLADRDLSSAYDLRNFRNREPTTDRLRGAQRPGLQKAFNRYQISFVQKLQLDVNFNNYGGLLTSDGVFWCIDQSDNLYYYVPSTDTLDKVTFSGSGTKSFGGLVENDGSLWCLPGSGGTLAKVDLSTKAGAFSTESTGGYQYREGFVYNGFLYAFALDTTHRYIKINLTTEAVTLTSGGSTNLGFPRFPSRSGNKIYWLPSSGTSFGKFDLETDTYSTVALNGDANWEAGEYRSGIANNGKVYGFNTTKPVIIEVDPSDDSFNIFTNGTASTANGRGASRLIAGPDGKVWGMPRSYGVVMSFDPSDSSFDTVSLADPDTNHTNGWAQAVTFNSDNDYVLSLPVDSEGDSILNWVLVNMNAGTVTEIDPASVMDQVGGYGYYGGDEYSQNLVSDANGEVYLFPNNSGGNSLLRFTWYNPATETDTIVQNIRHVVTTFKSEVFNWTGSGKWYGATKTSGNKIYAAPWYDASFLVIDDGGRSVYRIGNLNTTPPWKNIGGGDGTFYKRFNQGIESGGFLYFVPRMDPKGRKIDLSDDTISNWGDDFDSVGQQQNKWIGVALAGNGFIYGAGTNVLKQAVKITVSDGTVLQLGVDEMRIAKRWGLALADNGCLYSPPYGVLTSPPSSENQALKIDPSDDSVTQFGAFGTTSNNGEWAGAVKANNGKIYCIPANADSVLKLDPDTDTGSTFGDVSAESSPKWIEGALAGDGKIYCAPYNSDKVLVIDPATDTVSYMASSLLTAGGRQFNSIAMLDDGRLYCIPFDYDGILRITPPNVDDGWHAPNTITILR